MFDALNLFLLIPVMFFIMICFMAPEAFNQEFKCVNGRLYKIGSDHKAYYLQVYTDTGEPVECTGN